jgi:rhodanese-related sulfurtransferase
MNKHKFKDFLNRLFFHRRISPFAKLMNFVAERIYKNKMKSLLILLLSIAGILAITMYSPFTMNKSARYFRQMSELYVEPFTIIKGLENTIIFDIRPYERYKAAHIIDARHLKVQIDPQSGEILNKDEILKSVNTMRNRNDSILIYGENEYSLLTSQVAALLSENGVNVKLLSVGWNEFRHFSTFWLPENINARVDILDYIEGTEAVSTN